MAVLRDAACKKDGERDGSCGEESDKNHVRTRFRNDSYCCSQQDHKHGIVTDPPVDVDVVVERAKSCEAQAIVITGGEPLLYPLGVLTQRLRKEGLEIFLETSGTHPFSGEFDWVCLSPKRQLPPLDEAFGRAHELKVIISSEDDFAWAEENARRVGRYCRLYLQPEWSVYEDIMPKIVEYAKANPKWSISVQTHKFMHIP